MTSPHETAPYEPRQVGSSRRAPCIVVVGMGSEWRRDDGVGPAVARLVAQRCVEGTLHCRVVTPLGDALDLLGHWDGADLAVVVDATRSDLPSGSVSRIELEEPPSGCSPEVPIANGTTSGVREHPVVGRGVSSTHGIGLAGVLRLARAVGRAPVRAVVIGVEGEDFGHGTELSPAVSMAVDRAAEAVVELVEEASECA